MLREALRNKQAISYRFLRDDKGWRVFITTARPTFVTRSVAAAGAIGVDINADCLAVSEIDRFGNLVATRVVPLVTYGKTSHQAKALIGDAVKTVVLQAQDAGKPLVVEKLEFAKKKVVLEAGEKSRSRMLSSFAYNAILTGLKASAWRAGIEVFEVNPAYTSEIGLVNHAKNKGISVHQAAAFVIARRGCRFRERPIETTATVPTPRGDHVTFLLPARNRKKHVWSFWSAVQKSRKAVLAAHFRSSREGPAAPHPPLRKYPEFTVRFRDANRRQHCSADVMGDIPW